ncbi:hypothetical protein RE428_36290 [Marinobacter nanhaiticus D15-8W]|uniref:DUF2232 domain-containing protein n=1 Tax=Marinobacter nanhaiticus D15-8W TaxID=626887 RepID=N6WZ25_9GAMM|nr:hypothetical protein [Marinobacter nanhaiticus]ENO16796.1 hypothetical protein J057_03790 [Marinobacter nanhaiticus D15-8W]BES72611.1 hypothetical protein RE428_36290 [Marinobacter nanhaiticus D15-8W]
MRALAQFAMRGPLQASGVAAVTTAVPLLFWIGAAVVGLVILRLGLSQGLNVGLWALLPALGWSWFGNDPTALFVLVQVVVMVAVLRATTSWEKTLLTGSGLALVTGVLLPVFFPQLLKDLVDTAVAFYQQYNPDVASELGGRLESVVGRVMTASMAGTYLIIAVAVALLARNWQAKLYNPGGFRAEFHALRLSRPVAVLCVAAMFIAPVLDLNPVLVSWAAGLPLLIAGLGMIHGIVGARKMSVQWLVLFYIALVLLSPSLMLLLLILAFVDSWLDFRGRIKPSGPAE